MTIGSTAMPVQGKLTAPGGGGAGILDAGPAAVLIAGVLAAGVVELRRGGVSVLVTAIVFGFCAILRQGPLPRFSLLSPNR